MRCCAALTLTQRGGAAAPLSLTALCLSRRTPVSIGGRSSHLGFADTRGRSPRVKQTMSRDVPQRVAGTTKLRYTNRKGRTFTFSIPVTQLTHPPVNRRGASAAGWHEIDTSFSDVGDLEDDMPTELDERLAAARVNSEDGVVVEVNAEQLRDVQSAFVQLCKDYVLMDTSGMKTSMTYSELNNGPDYEHYDRKTRRRRHWIAIRHRFDDVQELLWPTGAAAEMRQRESAAAADEADTPALTTSPVAPLLPLPAMVEALCWLEAASTFAVRKHRPYDMAAASDFAPLDLSREVRVIAECIGVAGPSALVGSQEQQQVNSTQPLRKGATTPTPAIDDGDDGQRAAADRFISFAALCINHGVPLSLAFGASSSDLSSTMRDPNKGDSLLSGCVSTDATEAVHAWLSSLPALSRVKDAIRVMAVLQSVHPNTPASALASNSSPPSSSNVLAFSNEHGEVVNVPLLQALCRLASPSLFPHIAALENVDEGELCVLTRFVAAVQEENAAFLRATSGGSAEVREKTQNMLPAYTSERQALQHLTELAIARCRQLLYKTDGPRASLLSGDEENIPLVDLQAFAEHSHPEVRIHSKIGQANAQGLRYARLQSPASAALAQLLSRIEEANSRLATSTHTLRTDLLQHIAHKAALGKAKLSLEDITRALPLLAEVMRQTSEQQTKAKYDRLFAAMSISIGVGLQQVQKSSTVLNLLEGLAACHYVPSSYKLLEIVTLRLLMRGGFSLNESARAVVAMLQVVGPHGISQSVLQAVAMRVVSEVERSDNGGDKAEAAAAVSKVNVSDVLSVLRALRFSLYPSFPSLVVLVTQSSLTSNTSGWSREDHVHYAVLLTAAAGRLELSEEDAEVLPSLSQKAREELRLSRCEDRSTTGSVGGVEDANQEFLVTCAALQLSEVPPALKAWAHTPHRSLHSLRTPLLAVATLEAMEALHLAPSEWYMAYDRYLTRALEQVLHDGTKEPQRRLLEDDAQTAERTLFLSRVSAAARSAAAALLEREVERLDALLTDGPSRAESNGSSSSSSTMAVAAPLGGTDAQPVFSFQQKAMGRQTEAAMLEEQLLRYCVALKQHKAAAESGVDAAGADARVAAV
jgi:hypothetical protein